LEYVWQISCFDEDVYQRFQKLLGAEYEVEAIHAGREALKQGKYTRHEDIDWS